MPEVLAMLGRLVGGGMRRFGKDLPRVVMPPAGVRAMLVLGCGSMDLPLN